MCQILLLVLVQNVLLVLLTYPLLVLLVLVLVLLPCQMKKQQRQPICIEPLYRRSTISLIKSLVEEAFCVFHFTISVLVELDRGKILAAKIFFIRTVLPPTERKMSL